MRNKLLAAFSIITFILLMVAGQALQVVVSAPYFNEPMVHGDMYNGNTLVDLKNAGAGVWVNITNLKSNNRNRVEFIANKSLRPEIDGVYKISYSANFNGTNGAETVWAIATDGERRNETRALYDISQTGEDRDVSGSGTIRVNAGEEITIQVKDDDSPAKDITIRSIDVNILWIDNL